MDDLIIFGAPGAGKGTHATLLASRLNLRHLSTGEMLRAEVAAGTTVGRQAKQLIDSGRLVPDVIVDRIVEDYVGNSSLPCILDGYPRTAEQAVTLDVMLRRMGRRVGCVLSIEVPREELILRLEQRSLISNRSDDNEAVILHRLYEYETRSMDVLDYYRRTGLLLPIDASGSIEATQTNIRTALKERGLL